MRCSALLVALVLACGTDDEPDCPSLGCFGDTGSASTTTSTTNTTATTTATATTSSDPETSGSESGTPDPSTTADATTTSSESSSESSTGAPTCEGAECPALAECFGLGVWESCTQYCAALKTTCVAAGCDGATVVYYGDVDACTAMESSSSSPQGCDEGFDMGGGNSFGRCCCD